MNNEDYNELLFQKMKAEQKKYEEWLLGLMPGEILGCAYDYSVRQDILALLNVKGLTDAQAKVLLKSSTPLADIVKDWNNRSPRYMEDILDTIECRADRLIKKEQQRSRSEGAR